MSGSQAPRRALVLSAGRGERLWPLTDSVPKPLLPVLGRPVVERTLERIAAAGVEAAAINLHHLGEAIRGELGPAVAGMSLTYSTEEELLGTLGPFGKLQQFFAGVDPVLLVNGDSLCRWPIEEVARVHYQTGAEATLLLSATAEPDAFGGGVVTDREDRVLSFRGEMGHRSAVARGVFAGLHVISGRLLVGIDARPADIVRQLYEPLLAAGGAIRVVYTDRRWHDLGLPSRYLNAVLDEARSVAGDAGSWVAPSASVEGSAAVGHSVVEGDVVVGASAAISGSLLLAGARVSKGASVLDSILGPGVEISSGSRVESQLVTNAGPPVPILGGDATG